MECHMFIIMNVSEGYKDTKQLPTRSFTTHLSSSYWPNNSNKLSFLHSKTHIFKDCSFKCLTKINDIKPFLTQLIRQLITILCNNTINLTPQAGYNYLDGTRLKLSHSHSLIQQINSILQTTDIAAHIVLRISQHSQI